MNFEQAIKLTAGPLRFGHTGQISALKFLSQLEEAQSIIKAEKCRVCPGCNGAGNAGCDCGDEDCEQCRGAWTEACGLCGEMGILDSDSEPWVSWFDGNDAGEDVRLALVEWMKVNGMVAK